MNDINATLTQRGSHYGKFKELASLSQGMKAMMKTNPKWQALSCDKREALELIAMKIGRILNGDPNHTDSWTDIAGYATLVVKEIEGNGV